MIVLSWRQVDFAGVVFAGLVSGYTMALFGLWAGRFPGLTSVDIADFGRRYMVSDRPSAWFFGLASHLVNSVLFTFVWASVVAPNAGTSPLWSAVLWGIFLAIALAGALVAPMSGLGWLGLKAPGGVRFTLTNVLMHIGWGALVGLTYRPS